MSVWVVGGVLFITTIICLSFCCCCKTRSGCGWIK
eukprot:gene21737-52449_t